MTSEHVFKLYRAYKFFYAGKDYNFDKYLNIPCPALIEQKDRHFFYRISQRIDDTAVHGLFTVGFFFDPKTYISKLATPEAFVSALQFASRVEHGDTLYRNDLYELRKRLTTLKDTLEWLYGSGDVLIPPCVQELIAGELPIDIACMLLLVPQEKLKYHWGMSDLADDMGLGVSPWIDRLKKADQLLRLQRPEWRSTSFRMAKEFWESVSMPDWALTPPSKNPTESSLF